MAKMFPWFPGGMSTSEAEQLQRAFGSVDNVGLRIARAGENSFDVR